MLKKLVALLVLPTLVLAFIAGDPGIQSLLSKLQNFRETYPQEKVQLHLDRSYYSAGDTIYLKAYLLNGENNYPSQMSTVLYVDLSNNMNVVYRTLILPVQDGLAWGNIELPDSLTAGNYRITAYTNWMRNFDAAFLYTKTIEVASAAGNELQVDLQFLKDSAGKNITALDLTYLYPDDNQAQQGELTYSLFQDDQEKLSGKAIISQTGKFSVETKELKKCQQYRLLSTVKTGRKTSFTKEIVFTLPAQSNRIQFFPEGGQLLSGFAGRMGFKAVNENGFGQNISGEIRDGENNTVASFKTGVAGIGSFSFTPLGGATYYAQITYADGSKEKTEVPQPAQKGYSIAANTKDKDNVQINICTKDITDKEVVLLAQCNQVALIAQKVPLVNNCATVNVAKQNLPNGIVQFTLFTQAMQPVAERLVFINHHDQLQLALTPMAGKNNEKIKMLLQVNDESGEPVQGSFSIAITNGNAPVNEGNAGILPAMLLTGDLKDYVEDAGYYFLKQDAVTETALDDLMITQGWNRFLWKDLLVDKLPAINFKEEKSLSVTGSVKTFKGIPVANAVVTLLSKKGAGFSLDTTCDKAGNFVFDRLAFEDDMQFALQAIAPDGSRDLLIEVDQFKPAEAVDKAGTPFKNYNAGNAVQNPLNKKNDQLNPVGKRGRSNQQGITLEEVTLNAKKLTRAQEAVAPSANLNGPGNADQVLTYDDIQYCNDLAACLPGKLRGVLFKMVLIKGRITAVPYGNMGMNRPMLVVLNGMPMNDYSNSFSIADLPAGDVQSIEVLRSGAYCSVYGPPGAGGVLVITTKRGGLDYSNLDAVKKTNNQKPNGTRFFTLKGYGVSRQFYPPGYNITANVEGHTNTGTTIYWKPDILTDEKGQAVIEFNTAKAANLNIVVEGISGNGKVGSTHINYKIK